MCWPGLLVTTGVVTENVSDFARLASLGVAHGGLVFVLARPFPRTSGGLVRLGDALDAMLVSKQLPGRDGIIWLVSRADQPGHVPVHEGGS